MVDFISLKQQRQNDRIRVNYVAVVDHIYNSAGFRPYTKGERYNSLTEAYAAYEKLVAEKYPDYKDALPK